MALNRMGSTSEVASISTGKTLEIYGNGNQTRDFIYRDDLVRAILFAASVSGIGGETFQIATSAGTTIKELVEKLLPILSCAGYTNVQVPHAAPRCGDVRRNFSDTSKARKMPWLEGSGRTC